MGIQRIVGRAIYIMKSMSTVRCDPSSGPSIALYGEGNERSDYYLYGSVDRRSIQILDWSFVGSRWSAEPEYPYDGFDSSDKPTMRPTRS